MKATCRKCNSMKIVNNGNIVVMGVITDTPSDVLPTKPMLKKAYELTRQNSQLKPANNILAIAFSLVGSMNCSITTSMSSTIDITINII